MTPLTLDALRDLAPGFVMGTLTPDELAQFDAALQDAATAADLAPELEAHRAAVAFLATEHAVSPPPALRQRLVARIAAEATSRSDDDAMPAPTEFPLPFRTPGQAEYARTAAPRVGRPAAPPRATFVPPQTIVHRGSRAPWVGMGMLGVALAACVVFAVDLSNKVNELEGVVTKSEALRKRSDAQLAERNATMNTLTEAGADLLLIQLAPSQPRGPGIQLFWNVKSGTAVVHATGLRQVADNRTYVLWMIRDGTPVPVTLFKPDADGQRTLNGIELPKGTQGIAAFAVTEEPAEGSPQPTMTPFLIGTVAAPQ